MTDEAQANLEELIVELQEELKVLDPEWEETRIEQVKEQIALIEGKLASGEDSVDAEVLEGPQFSKKDITSESTPLGMKEMEVTVNGEKSTVTHTDLTTLDTPRKRWLYYFEHARSVNEAKGFLSHISDYAMEKGYTAAECIGWYAKAWDKVVGGRKPNDVPHRWDVCQMYFEMVDAAPETTEAQSEETLSMYEDLTRYEVDFRRCEELEKDSWDKALKALHEAENELALLKAQYDRMCKPAARLKDFIEQIYLNSPAADDFVERHKKKGTQYVDLPHGRIQKRAVAEHLTEVDNLKLKAYIGMMGKDTKDKFKITPITDYVFDDKREAFKKWLDAQPAEVQEKAGYKKVPRYSSITANFAKEAK
jgi:hypothetical protein